MSEALEARAEILKLARLLGRDPEQLNYLSETPSGDIRELREQVTDVLFTSGGPALERLAAGSRLLPVSLVASLGEHVFGAVLSARVAGLLEPDRAVEMASKLSVSFLADVAVELDPRRASAVISRIPPRQVASITRELTRRGEYVTMGRFVGHLRPEAIKAAVEAIDERELVQIAFVLEEKSVLVQIADLLGTDKLEVVIDGAAETGQWAEVFDLLGHLTDTQRAALVDAAAGRGDEILGSLVRAAQEQALWETVLPLVTLMSEESRRRLAAFELIQDGEILFSILHAAAARTDLWDPLLTLAAMLPVTAREKIGAIVTELELDQQLRGELAERIRSNGLHGELGSVADALDRGRQR